MTTANTNAVWCKYPVLNRNRSYNKSCIFKQILVYFSLFILFLERGEGRGKDKERNIDVRNIDQLPLVRTLTRDPTCNLGHVPWPGTETEPAIFCFAGWHPTNWATVVRVTVVSFYSRHIIRLCVCDRLIFGTKSPYMQV